MMNGRTTTRNVFSGAAAKEDRLRAIIEENNRLHLKVKQLEKENAELKTGIPIVEPTVLKKVKEKLKGK